ncbi:hypothetical protein Patl1_22416 [Pistacia atlantica]|uniref:Uncharacterized protein n=1 Tax=Pistacia atlantica TaxID=434234 RepID=A0ACC0ZXB1_9ROSI|nr:hypothetical protein Patl1_22416 [Pistacia atlantica]
MESTGLFGTDCESILSEIKSQEKQLKLKRRWLMGLPTSKSKRNRFKEPKFLKKDRSLPESLLRDDDIFYETVKTRVEESFGACTAEREHDAQDNMLLYEMHNIKRILISQLDALTSKGLYRIAMILTGGFVKFEKTRKQMKMVIRESLSKDLKSKNNYWKTNILKQLSLLLYDPQNFRENSANFLTPTLQSHYAATIKILAGLEDLPSQVLLSMDRKLRGVQGVMPQLRRHRKNRSRGQIIDNVRKISKKMLSELSKGDELQMPLAKAMAIAGLSLKLKPGCQNSSDAGFHQFSPEIRSLQSEIVKAICFLKTKVRFPELKTLQHLLDPNADVPNRGLRTAIKKMLIDYLFECSDMDIIPKSLLEALAIVNRSSRRTPYWCFPKEEIEQEVDCVLSVSAHTKQIIWDLLPDNGLDQDFTDAYMEELEESDGGSDYDDDSDYSDGDAEPDHEAEGVGESVPVDSKSDAPATMGNGSSAYLTPKDRVKKISSEGSGQKCFIRLGSDSHAIISLSQSLGSTIHCSTTNMDISQYQVETLGKVCSSIADGNSFSRFLTPHERFNHNLFEGHEVELNNSKVPVFSRDLFSDNLVDEDIKPSKQSRRRNQYVAIQEICDETSLVAYNVIGHMLEKFAKEEEIDLDCNDSSYLRGNSSIQEHASVKSESQTSPEEDASSSDVQMVEELVHFLPKSGIKKLKKLLGA